ncbi:MAG TPA: hypothetical protein VE869_12765 [Gemmatimonas sp.]|nr:hypothetical protein [Gemmatimonas sp.]
MTSMLHGLLQAATSAVQDTSAAAAAAGAGTGGAYVARPGGPPDTSAYMWAGYAIALVVYGGYILLLQRRIARTRNASGIDTSRAGRNAES